MLVVTMTLLLRCSCTRCGCKEWWEWGASLAEPDRKRGSLNLGLGRSFSSLNQITCFFSQKDLHVKNPACMCCLFYLGFQDYNKLFLLFPDVSWCIPDIAKLKVIYRTKVQCHSCLITMNFHFYNFFLFINRNQLPPRSISCSRLSIFAIPNNLTNWICSIICQVILCSVGNRRSSSPNRPRESYWRSLM